MFGTVSSDGFNRFKQKGQFKTVKTEPTRL